MIININKRSQKQLKRQVADRLGLWICLKQAIWTAICLKLGWSNARAAGDSFCRISSKFTSETVMVGMSRAPSLEVKLCKEGSCLWRTEKRCTRLTQMATTWSKVVNQRLCCRRWSRLSCQHSASSKRSNIQSATKLLDRSLNFKSSARTAASPESLANHLQRLMAQTQITWDIQNWRLCTKDLIPYKLYFVKYAAQNLERLLYQFI